jgi:two-component system, cell cycle sensor histidine kinase and response regulator CckA
MEENTTERQRGEQIQPVQAMDAVGRLAGGIAHDLNNILTAVNGYADLVLAALPAEDPVRADILEIRRAGERAALLTQRLLALGRRQVLTPLEVDLDAFIADLGNTMQDVVGEGIVVAIHQGAGGAVVLIDPNPLGEAMLSLAAHARDTMPDGGRLTISTAAVHAPEDTPSDPELAPGSWLRVAIADTGVGMDPETRAHAFEPYFTKEPRGKGTGLGLAIAWGIVAQCGGHLALSSEQGRGSTFRLYLPVLESGSDPGS